MQVFLEIVSTVLVLLAWNASWRVPRRNRSRRTEYAPPPSVNVHITIHLNRDAE
jgi:hypothetical protein